MTADAMQWETPPRPSHGYDWADIARDLRANPNRWLKVFEAGPVSIVNAIRQASITALQPIHRPGRDGYGFEVKTYNNSLERPRTCTLYLRWVPDLEVDEEEGEDD
jgi:hypothetical protein